MPMPGNTLATHRARSTCALGIGLLLAGCSGTAGAESGAALGQPVLHGTASTADQNAVVLILREDGFSGTGSLVAPRLVLTTKQLLFAVGNPNEPFVCAELARQAVDQVLDPGGFTVGFGEKRPLHASATGIRIHSGGSLDLCTDDLALLEIDKELPIAPLPMRLNGPPQKSERGLLIGWGMSDAAAPSQTVAGTRQQLDVQIRALAGEIHALPAGDMLRVQETAFMTDAGGCYGDDGAPFLSRKTGAIVGILSTFEPESLEPTADSVGDCAGGYPMFQAVSTQREWLFDAFREAGAAPSVEGLAPPAAGGEACEVDEECLSGRCLHTRSAGFCSVRCETAPCDAGQQCVSIDDAHWCIPERIGEFAETSSCRVSNVRSQAWFANPVPLLALLFLIQRSRVNSRIRGKWPR